MLRSTAAGRDEGQGGEGNHVECYALMSVMMERQTTAIYQHVLAPEERAFAARLWV